MSSWAAGPPTDEGGETVSVVREIMQLDAQRDWLEGGTNHDEDLHFSTYYLRASLADVSGTGFPGYSIIVANY
ncbi:MAG TPA: hypothetical protein VF944_08770, partial [Candidatus Bathyarchaeia archaeon]